MPMFVFKCSKCGFSDEFLVGATTGSKSPETCPQCSENNSMEKQMSMSGISGEVVGGYDYEYGKKSWRKTGTLADKASIIAGDKDPY